MCLLADPTGSSLMSENQPETSLQAAPDLIFESDLAQAENFRNKQKKKHEKKKLICKFRSWRINR